MNRRQFLSSLGTAATVSLTGCAALRFTRTVSLDDGAYPQIYHDAANTNHPETQGPETEPKIYWTANRTGTFFVDSENLYVDDVALNVRDGNVSQQLEPDQFLEPGCIRDNAVYGISTNGDAILAVDVETGERLWRTDTVGGVGSQELTVTEDSIYLKATVKNDDKYATRTVALDRSTGERRWTGPEFQNSIGPAAVVDDTAFDTAHEDGLYALSTEDGSVRWSVEGESFGSAVSTSNGKVYALTIGDQKDGDGIHAFDAGDGSKIWDRWLPVSGQFAVSEDMVYIITHPAGGISPKRDLSRARLLALNAETGETRWKQQTPVGTTPTLADGTLYVGGRPELQTGMIAAYDAETGEERWRFTRSVDTSTDTGPKPASVSWPAVVDKYVFIWIEETLYALG